jgi:ABC-2 type transport system ATP-binding protein
VIEIEGLYKYYGAYRAVGPLSAEIRRGEVVGLLGLNGAGKTTTLRILSCDLLPSAGTVRVDGVDVVGNPGRVRSMIGYLPDTPPLYDEMSVRRYLEFAARLRRMPGSRVGDAVRSTLEAAGLREVAEELIGTLSHGYRQRVGIAQAIVHGPKLVVLDEPSSGLDPVQIREMRALVRSLGKDHTVLVSSHNLPEISEMCDRLLVIGEGEIVASGTEQELVQRWVSGERLDIELGLAGQDADAVQGWLSTLSGVERVELLSRKDQHLHLLVQTSRDVRPELSRAIVERGLALLGFARSERELESVFATLARERPHGQTQEAA